MGYEGVPGIAGGFAPENGTGASTPCSNRIPSAPRPAIAAVNELRDRKGEKRTKRTKIPRHKIPCLKL